MFCSVLEEYIGKKWGEGKGDLLIYFDSICLNVAGIKKAETKFFFILLFSKKNNNFEKAKKRALEIFSFIFKFLL
jgi:hypothetical protein